MLIPMERPIGAEREPAALLQTPELRKTVHVEVGEYRTDHAVLRRSFPLALSPIHAPFSSAVPLGIREIEADVLPRQSE
jgi:hypothetical protein